jgi:hypothetical protein
LSASDSVSVICNRSFSFLINGRAPALFSKKSKVTHKSASIVLGCGYPSHIMSLCLATSLPIRRGRIEHDKITTPEDRFEHGHPSFDQRGYDDFCRWGGLTEEVSSSIKNDRSSALTSACLLVNIGHKGRTQILQQIG